MRKLIAVLFASSLLISPYMASAASKDETPTAPVQSAGKPGTPNTNAKPEYLETQPENVMPKNDGTTDSKSKHGDSIKKLEKGKSHNKEPDAGGVEVK